MAKEIPPQIIYAIIFIVFIIALVTTIPTPLAVEKPVENFHGAIVSAKGGIAVWSTETQFAQIESVGPIEMAVLKTLAANKIKIIIEPFNAQGPQYAAKLLATIKIEEVYGYKYGVDYVIMPYLAGEEVAFAKGTDFEAAYATDVYGTPRQNLPLLQGLKTFADIDLIICVHLTCTWPDLFMRQYWTVYHKPMILLTNGCSTAIAPYLGKGVIGYIDGLGMGAQFELLANVPGGCMRMITPRSLQGVLIICFVIAGNIIYFATRSKGEKKEVKK